MELELWLLYWFMLGLSPHNKRLLYSVTANWPDAQEAVLAELTALDWQYTSGFEQRARVETHDQHSTALDNTYYLKRMVEDVRAQQTNLLTYMYSNEEFSKHIWPGTTLEQLLANTSTVCELYRDNPGWRTGVHIDHRAAVATGMLFFEPKNDKNKSTYFYTTEKRTDEQRMSCAYATGWYAANTHRSWHTGGNMGRDLRYSLLFASFLRLGTHH